MRPSSQLLLGALCAAIGMNPIPLPAQASHPARQFAAAVLPLPAELRGGAGVVGLDQDGQPQVWRQSVNGMVCLADTPGDAVFDVRCYHASFVRLIYRLRQLAASGVPDSALEQTVDLEIRTGKLRIAQTPTAGYRMLGPIAGFDSVRVAVSDTVDAWQSVHFPYQTAAAMGLSTSEDGIHPYVMASGTFWAHVMIMQRPLRY